MATFGNFYTHAFDFYYKWCPTGSLELEEDIWYISSSFFDFLEDNSETYQSWYNIGQTVGYPYQLTRKEPSSLLVPSAGALPWTSAAHDLLWNVLVPSASVSRSVVEQKGDFRIVHDYNFTFVSESFLRTLHGANGLEEYPITSSWIAYEPLMVAEGFSYRAQNAFNNPANPDFPATMTATPYAMPYSSSYQRGTYPGSENQSINPLSIGSNPPNVFYTDAATGSLDGRFFDLAGGCGITRASISASLVEWNAYKSSTVSTQRALAIAALKKRRLFFPTVADPNDDTASYWFGRSTSLTYTNAAEFFTENGGIYNVKFNLKRDVSNDFYPDSGQGSELLVYIHDINLPRLNSSGNNAQPGDSGFYPPENNIVRIKNTPAMSFANPATGYLIETFNINVVQYGGSTAFPCQLVFEASGSLSTENYFGCIIDDVTFCKVGVSTDPNLIKPTTTGGTTAPADPLGDEATE